MNITDSIELSNPLNGAQTVAEKIAGQTKAIANKAEVLTYELGVTLPLKHPLLFAIGKTMSLMAAAYLANHMPQIINGVEHIASDVSGAMHNLHMPEMPQQDIPTCTLPADGQVPVETTVYDALRDNGIHELALNEAAIEVQAHNPGVDFNALQPDQILDIPQEICELNKTIVQRDLGTFNVTISEGGNLLQAIRSHLDSIGVPADQIEATTNQVVQNNGGIGSFPNIVHAGQNIQIDGKDIVYQDLSRLPAEVLSGNNSNPELLATQAIATGVDPTIQPTASLDQITKAMPDIQPTTTTNPEQNPGNGGIFAIGGVLVGAGAIGAFLAHRLGFIGKKKA